MVRLVIQFHCLYYSATRLWYEPSKLSPVFAYAKYVFFWAYKALNNCSLTFIYLFISLLVTGYLFNVTSFQVLPCKECIVHPSVARTQLLTKVIQEKGKAVCPWNLLAEPELFSYIVFKGPVNTSLPNQSSCLSPAQDRLTSLSTTQNIYPQDRKMTNSDDEQKTEIAGHLGSGEDKGTGL